MKENMLCINSSKTKALFFNSPLDLKLNFGLHIDNISREVCLTFRKLYNLNLYLPIKVKHIIRHSLLMAHVNYGVEVFFGWPRYNLGRVQSIVNCITHFVYGVKFREHILSFIHAFFKFSFLDYKKFRLRI